MATFNFFASLEKLADEGKLAKGSTLSVAKDAARTKTGKLKVKYQRIATSDGLHITERLTVDSVREYIDDEDTKTPTKVSKGKAVDGFLQKENFYADFGKDAAISVAIDAINALNSVPDADDDADETSLDNRLIADAMAK